MTWLIGCQKCGSSSLAFRLQHLRLACFSNVTGVNEGKAAWYGKETHFWDAVDQGETVDVSNFLELFPAAWAEECNTFLEGTPNYLAMPLVPSTLRQLMPGIVQSMARIITVLREPIARDLSAYNHQRFNGDIWVTACPALTINTYDDYAACEVQVYRQIMGENTTTSDETTLSQLRTQLHYGLWSGLYAPQIQAWADAFGRDQLFIIHYDHLTGNFDAVFRALRLFLDDPTYNEVGRLSSKNVMNFPEKQRVVNCATVDMLNAEVFDAWNAQLFARFQEDRLMGRAPVEEPEFPPFASMPSCQ